MFVYVFHSNFYHEFDVALTVCIATSFPAVSATNVPKFDIQWRFVKLEHCKLEEYGKSTEHRDMMDIYVVFIMCDTDWILTFLYSITCSI